MTFSLPRTLTTLALLTSGLLFAGCDQSVKLQTNVLLTNNAKLPTSMWIGHATDPEPGSLLPIGGSRMVSVEVDGIQEERDASTARLGGGIRVNAKKEGSDTIQELVYTSGKYQPGVPYKITFDGKGFTDSY